MKEVQKTDKEIESLMEIARENNVHIDAAVNPFINDAERQEIIQGQKQDPEWD